MARWPEDPMSRNVYIILYNYNTGSLFSWHIYHSGMQWSHAYCMNPGTQTPLFSMDTINGRPSLIDAGRRLKCWGTRSTDKFRTVPGWFVRTVQVWTLVWWYMIFHPQPFPRACIYACINYHQFMHPDLPVCTYVVPSCSFHSINIHQSTHQSIHPPIPSSAQLGTLANLSGLDWFLILSENGTLRGSWEALPGFARGSNKSVDFHRLSFCTPGEEYYTNPEMTEKMQGDWGLTGFSRSETMRT